MKKVNKHIEIRWRTIKEIHTGCETEWKLNVETRQQWVRPLGVTHGPASLEGVIPAQTCPLARLLGGGGVPTVLVPAAFLTCLWNQQGVWGDGGRETEIDRGTQARLGLALNKQQHRGAPALARQFQVYCQHDNMHEHVKIMRN